MGDDTSSSNSSQTQTTPPPPPQPQPDSRDLIVPGKKGAGTGGQRVTTKDVADQSSGPESR